MIRNVKIYKILKKMGENEDQGIEDNWIEEN